MIEEKNILRETIKRKGEVFTLLLIKTNNGCLALFSEGEAAFGTLAVSVPQRVGISDLPVSSILLGDRSSIIAKMLAEKLALKMGKTCLVSIYIKTLKENEVGEIFLDLLNIILERL